MEPSASKQLEPTVKKKNETVNLINGVCWWAKNRDWTKFNEGAKTMTRPNEHTVEPYKNFSYLSNPSLLAQPYTSKAWGLFAIGPMQCIAVYRSAYCVRVCARARTRGHHECRMSTGDNNADRASSPSSALAAGRAIKLITDGASRAKLASAGLDADTDTAPPGPGHAY